MQPVKTYSPVMFYALVGVGSAVLIGLLLVAWTNDTPTVRLAMSLKLRISAAAFVIGGGLIGVGLRYRAQARADAELQEMVRRNLQR